MRRAYYQYHTYRKNKENEGVSCDNRPGSVGWVVVTVTDGKMAAV